ncbi:hypothetical protein CIP107570_00123 [Corynebacterium diphtheriae]|nr:hypothetical protein CIP107570_00123 [Corynebacterium diphtheriae]
MATNSRRVGELEQAFCDSIAALEADGIAVPEKYSAVVMLGRLYAFNIDESVNTDTEQATKALYLGPHLMGVMKLLGTAPTEANGEDKSSAPSNVVADRMKVLEIMKEYKKQNGG